jgi:fatty-acyl-CoA synthase
MTVIEMNPAQQTGGKDSALRDWVRALEATAPIIRNPERLLLDAIEATAATRADTPALLSARERLTYRELVSRANRYARWALGENLAKGETIGLLMPNRPEYMAIWLGITAVGGAVALLNTNLRDRALAHCIDIVAPRHLIVAAELFENYRSAAPHLSTGPKIWAHDSEPSSKPSSIEFPRIDRDMEQYSPERLSPAERRGVTIADRALAIYTSGTTGLPKAANASHQRVLQWSFWFAGLVNTGSADRMYNCLPMYHSVGGVVATGAILVNGGSVVLRDKFSVQNFWNDICEWDCTLFQYIGELCRYLLNAPEHPHERAHRLRLCCGNGLRADVWEQFQTRFHIPRVLEYYAATEGNFSLYNVEGKVGAIGRLPSFLTHRFPLALVQFDHAAGEPARGNDGFCIRCATDEPGEAIGRIGDSAGGAFEGYTNDKESERKILRNVFEKGDAWYRTGDLMRRDSAGFFYFVDRVGDTFRWKGENVATSEVAAAIMTFPGISEATVYGVAVPGAEGAVGMAAIVADGPLDFGELRKQLADQLPAYARPLFLRMREKIEATATFKYAKHELQRQGYDPTTTTDPIYFAGPDSQSYLRLDAELYGRITSKALRL